MTNEKTPVILFVIEKGFRYFKIVMSGIEPVLFVRFDIHWVPFGANLSLRFPVSSLSPFLRAHPLDQNRHGGAVDHPDDRQKDDDAGVDRVHEDGPDHGAGEHVDRVGQGGVADGDDPRAAEEDPGQGVGQGQDEGSQQAEGRLAVLGLDVPQGELPGQLAAGQQVPQHAGHHPCRMAHGDSGV